MGHGNAPSDVSGLPHQRPAVLTRTVARFIRGLQRAPDWHASQNRKGYRMGLYVEVEYRGDWWGEDPITETVHETTGDLYRSLAGIDKSRPWEALGRCTGKVYIDENGTAHQVGWVFIARNPEPVNRGDTQPTGLREAWVTVHTEPPTITRTRVDHFATFGKDGAA